MPLAEGVQARVVYKAYATGAITSNSQPVSATDPAVTGGQVLRRVSTNLELAKDTYTSAEIRADRQIGDFRHGVKRVTGSISGELSPLTYADLVEAAFRGTRAAAVTKSNTELTSAAADSTTSKFTFGGGNPVTEGFRVGMIVRFTNMSDAGNNTKNFLITSFGAANNRDMFVYPAPVTQGADVAFNVASIGKTLFVPSTGFVSRKFAFEVYHEDLDIARLFTECRIGGVNWNLPATGINTIDLTVMGRDMESYSAGSAPFFTAPSVATTTGLTAAVNGLLRLGGAAQGVVTGASVNLSLNPQSDAVVGQNFVPEIFLGRANVSGQLTAFFESMTLSDIFKNETEATLQLYLTATNDVASPAMAITLPRIKLGGASLAVQGEAGLTLTMPYQALKYETAVATAGIENTTIYIADTEIP
jgi:hypothetical protein